VARGETIPRVSAAVRFTASGAILRLTADREPAEARLWTAPSLTRDFQRARWEERELAAANDAWEATLVPPDAGYLGFFAEFVFLVDGLRLHVSSPTRVLDP
jgi:hypothetical protein